MCFAVPQISRGRSNQFCNFVRVLELRAIHLDHRARISKQHLRSSLDDARLPRARRPQEQQISHRPSRRIQPGAKHLVQVNHRLHRFVLPHNLPPQPCLKIPRLRTPACRIQLAFYGGIHFAVPPAGLPALPDGTSKNSMRAANRHADAWPKCSHRILSNTPVISGMTDLSRRPTRTESEIDVSTGTGRPDVTLR